MKKNLLILSLLVTAVTSFVYVNKSFLSKEESGDKLEVSEISYTTNLGQELGRIEHEPLNQPENISKVELAYILYHKGEITFQEQIDTIQENLKWVTNMPYLPELGYLSPSGYSPESKVQVYFIGDKDLGRTVVFKVTAGDKENLVEIIYDDEYCLTVIVNDNDSRLLDAYLTEESMFNIEV